MRFRTTRFYNTTVFETEKDRKKKIKIHRSNNASLLFLRLALRCLLTYCKTNETTLEN